MLTKVEGRGGKVSGPGRDLRPLRAARPEQGGLRRGPGLKGSIGEGPNHSNHSNHSNSFKIRIFRNFSLENSKISENFNINFSKLSAKFRQHFIKI